MPNTDISLDTVLFMQPDVAQRSLAALATHSPEDWWDYSNLASAYYVFGRDPIAVGYAREALALDRNPLTLMNLGVMLETHGQFDKSLPLAAEAFRLYPSAPHVACWYSDALLRSGDFAAAWPIYSASHADWSWVSRVIPEWNGRGSLQGKRLLVLSGGGYGDNILFARWLPYLDALGATVTLMCPPTLQPLLIREPYIANFLSGSAAGLIYKIDPSDYDCFTCILALGGYFCPTPSDIPPAPYLTADPELVRLRQMTLRSGATPLIGICTRAGEEKFPRRHRSLSAEQSAKLLSTRVPTGADWINLNLTDPLPGTIHPAIRDWADTAAILANLDLLVTVDTGVAHLAGALGVPTFVILPGISAPYYGTSGDHCDFYPSHTLFRNSGIGTDSSVAACCRTLAAWRPNANR